MYTINYIYTQTRMYVRELNYSSNNSVNKLSNVFYPFYTRNYPCTYTQTRVNFYQLKLNAYKTSANKVNIARRKSKEKKKEISYSRM